MRKLLNTLYITTENGYLYKDGENVALKVDNVQRFTLPIHNIEGIICIGNVAVSAHLMGFCAERQVALSFVSDYGKFLARSVGKIYGSVLVRKKLYRMSDDIFLSLEVARNFIISKVYNSRTVLERGLRDHQDKIDDVLVERCSRYLKERIGKIREAKSLELLRGFEGECARVYFEGLNELILVDKCNFFMQNRSRRPPLDNMNAILSYLYVLLMHDIQAALESVGLDSYVGFLHRDRPGRASLALDLMEELRPYLVDRLALSLINRKQIESKDFIQKESGAVLITDEARKVLLAAWQKRKKEEIVHPFLKEKISLGLIPYVQAMLLSRYIREELEAYPPFLWK